MPDRSNLVTRPDHRRRAIKTACFSGACGAGPLGGYVYQEGTSALVAEKSASHERRGPPRSKTISPARKKTGPATAIKGTGSRYAREARERRRSAKDRLLRAPCRQKPESIARNAVLGVFCRRKRWRGAEQINHFKRPRFDQRKVKTFSYFNQKSAERLSCSISSISSHSVTD